MIKEMWNATHKVLLWVAIFAILCGIGGILLLQHDRVFNAVKPAVALEEMSPEDISDQYVKFNYNYTLGNISQRGSFLRNGTMYYSTGFSKRLNIIVMDGVENHLEKDSAPCYFLVVAIGDDILRESGEVEANSEAVNELLADLSRGKKVTKEDLQAVMTDNFEIRGQLKPMGNDMELPYQAFFEALGYTDEEIEKYCLPYYISLVEKDTTPRFAMIFSHLVCIVIILLGIWTLVSAIRKDYQRPLIKRLNAAGPNELARAENDFKRAKVFIRGIYLGEEFVFGINNSDAVAYNSILWVYPFLSSQWNTSYMSNRKTIKQNCVIICDDSGMTHKFVLTSGGTAEVFMQKIAAKCPGIVVGYSDEASQLFKYHRDEMTRMRDAVREERKREKEAPRYLNSPLVKQ